MTFEEQAKKIEEQGAKLIEFGKLIAELTEQLSEQKKMIAAQKKELEEWRRGHRNRKGRFSSKAEAKSGVESKKPGRKDDHEPSFREVPGEVDKTFEYPVPEVCSCGGALEATGEVERVIEEEIPEPKVIRIAHCAQVGKCTRCGKRVMAKLPGAARDGQPFARVVVGPRAQALGLSVRFEHHVSLRSTSRLLERWCGLRISAGGLSQISTRRARHTATAKEEDSSSHSEFSGSGC